MFSRAGSSYQPNRKLWVRKRTGHCVPNPAIRLRTQGDGAAFRPLYDVLGIDLLDEHLIQRR